MRKIPSITILTNVLLVLSSLFFWLAAAGAAAEENNYAHDYIACTEVPALGTSCIDVYYNTSTLRAGVKLIVGGFEVLDEHVEGDRYCANEASLLRILELNPMLLPYAPVIEKIIEVEKYLPVHVFSICIELVNIDITRDHFAACTQLASYVICLQDKCLYQGIDKFGCFNMPLDEAAAAAASPMGTA
eukprot:GEZU01041248.1.p1 GENE.GEZU01041248.1~~GEZU01041248.1.p1  ORF type:complete len:188 (+),score=39.37 GEZU01041248.1:52-615(+)